MEVPMVFAILLHKNPNKKKPSSENTLLKGQVYFFGGGGGNFFSSVRQDIAQVNAAIQSGKQD